MSLAIKINMYQITNFMAFFSEGFKRKYFWMTPMYPKWPLRGLQTSCTLQWQSLESHWTFMYFRSREKRWTSLLLLTHTQVGPPLTIWPTSSMQRWRSSRSSSSSSLSSSFAGKVHHQLVPQPSHETQTDPRSSRFVWLLWQWFIAKQCLNVFCSSCLNMW